MIKYITAILVLFSINPVFAYISTNHYSPYYNRQPNICSKSTYADPSYGNRPYRNYNSYRPHRHGYYRPPCRHCDYYSPYNEIQPGNLNALERYALKKNYTRESDLSRLERLESLAFGAVQEGDLTTRYQNVENAILSRPPQNGYKRSVIGSIADFLGGQMTGFTPSLNSGFGNDVFSNYPTYSNTRAEQYSNGIFGGGWGVQNQNFGNGSSIRILD